MSKKLPAHARTNRRIKHLTNDQGGAARITYNNDTEEYEVYFWDNATDGTKMMGCLNLNRTYYTDDKQDAIGTAELELAANKGICL